MAFSGQIDPNDEVQYRALEKRDTAGSGISAILFGVSPNGDRGDCRLRTSTTSMPRHASATGPRGTSRRDRVRLDLVPRLRDDARRLHEHAADSKRAINGNDTRHVHAKSLSAKSIQPLDAVLGTPTVATHIPLADRACLAWHRIRLSDNRYDEVAG